MQHRFLTALPLLGLLACVAPTDGAGETRESSAPPATAVAVAPESLALEQAERSLDRGDDAAPVEATLRGLLDGGRLATDEVPRARVALSRALEAGGDREGAVALVEAALADSAHQETGGSAIYRRRLRELLSGAEEPPRRSSAPRSAAPFARVLADYFAPDAEGRVGIEILVAGRGPDHQDMASLDIAAGVRANRDDACPLCDDHLDINTGAHQSDWVIIPAERAGFDDAVVVFFYDLEENRIPARYSDEMPLDVGAIEARLQQGESFVVASATEGTPPRILIAAPRRAMLAEVEAALAQLDHLPVEPLVVDVSSRLRSDEIQGVIRGQFYGVARGCYDQLLTSVPDAAGKVVLELSVDAQGAVASVDLEFEGDEVLASPTLQRCFREGAETLRFPAAGDVTSVRYPIALSPR